MAAKARRWLDAGVHCVWVVLPQTQQVEVWRREERESVLSPDDDLSGEDVLPGFVYPIRDLFP